MISSRLFALIAGCLLTTLSVTVFAGIKQQDVDNLYDKIMNTNNGFVAKWTSGGKPYMRPIYTDLQGHKRSTASEGVAYLMVLSALQKDKSNWDRSYNYWKLYTDQNAGRGRYDADNTNLMPWLIDQYGTVKSWVPAADADLDIAYALLVADKHWGGYKNDAMKVIAAIKKELIAPNLKIVLPWPMEHDSNEYGQYSFYITSYNMPGYYGIYGRATGDTAYWNDVTQKTYDWLQYKHLHPDTNLNSYGAFDNGDSCTNRSDCSYFEVDSMRLPIRIAHAYMWNKNDTRAKQILDKLTTWITNNVSTTDVRAEYEVWGSPRVNYGSAAMRSIFAQTVQEAGWNTWWSDDIWNRYGSNVGGDFYQQSVTAIAMFSAAGRFIDPTSNNTTPAPTPTAAPTPVPTTTPPVDGALPKQARLQDNWNGLYINVNTEDDWSETSVLGLNANWGSMQWNVERVQGNTYRLKNVWTGDYLSSGNTEEWSAILSAPLNEEWGSQRWIFEKVDGNRYRIKNEWTGLYLNTAADAGETLRQAELREDWGSMIWNVSAL